MVIGPEFEFDLPEGGRLEETHAFKIRLLRTLQFLKENNRPYWTSAEREHTAFLASVGESGLSTTDMQQIKEAKEKSEREVVKASRVPWVGGQAKTWRYRVVERDGNTMVSLDGLVMVFEGAAFSGMCSGNLQLSGEGTSSGSIGSGKQTVSTSYGSGEAILTFGGHTFKLLDEGRRVVFGDQEFRIGNDRPTLVIAGDGTATMASSGADAEGDCSR
jgi:hypothetical protein